MEEVRNLNREKHSIVWDISLEMLLIFSATVCNAAILFAFGISVSSYHFAGAVLMAFAVMRYLRREPVQRTIGTVSAAVAIILLLCAMSGAVYDTTWDGAAYHKQAVGLLHAGWNPLYQSSTYYESIAHTMPYAAENPLKWAEVYPKASWYFASVVYCIFRNIEAGKAYTLIFMLITGGFFYDYCRAKKIRTAVCSVIAILAALNPISVAQCQSYYLDGLACSVAMCLLLLMIRSFDETVALPAKEYNVSIVALLVVGCNLKFSILLLCVVYCFVYVAACGVLYVKKQCTFQSLLGHFCVLAGGGDYFHFSSRCITLCHKL